MPPLASSRLAMNSDLADLAVTIQKTSSLRVRLNFQAMLRCTSCARHSRRFNLAARCGKVDCVWVHHAQFVLFSHCICRPCEMLSADLNPNICGLSWCPGCPRLSRREVQSRLLEASTSQCLRPHATDRVWKRLCTCG